MKIKAANIKKSHLFTFALFAAIGITGLIYSLQSRDDSSAWTPEPKVVAEPTLEEAYPHVVKPNTSLYISLRELNVDSQTIQQIVTAAKGKFDLGRLQPGTRFQLVYSIENQLTGIHFRFSPVEKLNIDRVLTPSDATAGETEAPPTWTAQKITEQVETRVVTFSGKVTDTLWASAGAANMDANLISELSEIFAWQVDFAREVRQNDRWRLSVERNFVKGEPIGWGSILAAEYENDGQLYTAFLFRLDGDPKGYFAADGTSLRRMFLKSPIHFARISSRFQKKRFHPILAVNRAHLGVDYAAKTGTPVRAVGDGVVTMASWSGGGGKVIKLRHNSTYQTAYKHLSGYAKGIRSGARVRQGQIIGYVGSTGLSTGPHLHFEFFQNGSYVDPLGRKFPSADPVAAQYLQRFQSDAALLKNSLPSWEGADKISATDFSSTSEAVN